MGLVGGDRVPGSVLAAVFDSVPDTPIVVVEGFLLEFCPAPTVSGAVVESLRGRPLLRFGERGGLPSSFGEAGGRGGDTLHSGSDTLGGVLGGRPLFLFIGAITELTLGSAEVLSLPGGVSVFLGWFPPLPLPRCWCCSPSWAAIRDSVSSLRRTGRFLSTGMSGERWGGEYGG